MHLIKNLVEMRKDGDESSDLQVKADKNSHKQLLRKNSY